MPVKQSDRVRQIVSDKYVRPALRAGQTRLSIRVRDVLKDAEATEDFPRGRTPLVCNVLNSKKLLRDEGLELESVDGPPSGQSRTVVFHYTFTSKGGATPNVSSASLLETSAERAERLTNKLRGLLREEMKEYGGVEGFIRWIRHDEVPK